MKLHRDSIVILMGLLCIGSALQSASAAADAIQSSLSLIGGAHHVFVVGAQAPKLHLSLSSLDHQAHRVDVSLRADDLWGRPTDWKRNIVIDLTGPDAGAMDIELPGDVGFYDVWADFTSGAFHQTNHIEMAVVYPPAKGIRPDSFFASNTSNIKTGEDLLLLERIGMKIQRSHFQPRYIGKLPETTTGAALPLDFTDQDKALADAEAHGLWVLPIVGYSFENAISDWGQKAHMYGPPRNSDEFINTWKTILQHYPRITTYEFWNEPWLYGWTWAGTGQEYRDLQTAWCRAALAINPKLRIIAGNSSMFVEDHIEPFPDCWKGLLSGTSHHPYSAGASDATLRGGDQNRSIDSGMVVTRRMGLPYYYLTEGGTLYKPPSTQPADDAASQDAQDNNNNAFKIVQYYLHAALSGAFQGDAQWEIGYGPAWTRSNATFAFMTHCLEDRPIVADIWPSNELIWGAIFARPDAVTPEVKALPRAGDFSARWTVPVPNSADADPAQFAAKTKVAVIWSTTGGDNGHVDTDGTLTIANVGDIKAFDCTGRPIPPTGGKLTVPFTQYPIYLTTNALDVVTFRNAIAAAEIQNVTPVNLYALSLLSPVTENQSLGVRIENQLNRTVKGVLKLHYQTGGTDVRQSAPFTLSPAQLLEVPVPWLAAAANPENLYPITLTAETDAGTVSRDQVVGAAFFAHRTIKIDGDLSAWNGIVPVILDSGMLRDNALMSGPDLTRYLLNPNLHKPPQSGDLPRLVGGIFTAYDDDNVYIAAAVNEPHLVNTAGTPATVGDNVKTAFLNGEPDGLNHIRNDGDAFLFSFGFRDRVPGHGRQMDDPYAWKGHFYDTDYHYAANISANGDQLIRQWGPDTSRQTAYQTETVPGVGPVPGAKIVIHRDEAKKLTVYDISIPRSELKLFDPSKGRCRFGFLIINDEKVPDTGALEWSRAAGVFDYWKSSGSFAPSWEQVLPCQTFFGIAR